jgi:hypothetical protein
MPGMDDYRLIFPPLVAGLTFPIAWILFVMRDMRSYDAAIRSGRVPPEKIWATEVHLWYVRSFPPESRAQALRVVIVRRFFNGVIAAVFALFAAGCLLAVFLRVK